jgi:hypothetical protein
MLTSVPRPSPLRAGFSAVWRRPSLVLAEIAWRWVWGLASLLMLVVAGRAYLRSLTVSGAERFELRSGNPSLFVDAIARIFEGSGGLFIKLALVVLPPIVLLWIIAASLGRAATLDALLGGKGRAAMRPLLGLHFLRAAALLAAALAYMGAGLLAGLVIHPAPDADPQAVFDSMGGFLLIFLGIVIVVVGSWSVVNWFLSLAPLLVVRDGRDGLAALSGAVALYRRRRSDFLTVGTILGVLRFLWLVAITILSLIAAAILGDYPWMGAALLVALALAYFAFADLLFIVRLAAYVAIAEPEEPAAAPPAVVTAPPPVLAPSPDA